MRRLAYLAPLVACVPAFFPGAPAATGPCGPHALSAAFREVPYSSGAGQITYRVRLRNAGASSCTVSGRPGLRLLDRHGRALPTHVLPDAPGTATAVLVTLAPGRTAVADARFSPDVPGSGEPVTLPCEPKAHAVRVSLASPGHGALRGPVSPPTPVCEHGRIVLGLLHGSGR